MRSIKSLPLEPSFFGGTVTNTRWPHLLNSGFKLLLSPTIASEKEAGIKLYFIYLLICIIFKEVIMEKEEDLKSKSYMAKMF
jgi:hypothetical protein